MEEDMIEQKDKNNTFFCQLILDSKELNFFFFDFNINLSLNKR